MWDRQSEQLLEQNHGLLHREFLQTTEGGDCEEFDWSFPYRKARKALVLKDQLHQGHWKYHSCQYHTDLGFPVHIALEVPLWLSQVLASL